MENNIEDHQTFLNELINPSIINVERDRIEPNTKSLAKNSVIEKFMYKFLYNFGRDNNDLHDLLNSIKEMRDTHASDFDKMQINRMLRQYQNDLRLIAPLFAETIDHALKAHQNLTETHKEFSFREAFPVEKHLREHLEANFFQLKSNDSVDNNYFNQNYVKLTAEKPHFNYSVIALETTFKILKTLERQSLECKDPDIANHNEGIISDKKLNFIHEKTEKIDRTDKDYKAVHGTNLIDLLTNSHIKNILQHLYDTNSNTHNFEIENKICLSLFIIKKIVKDYSFYFDKKPEIERMFINLKKFKE